MGLMKRETRGLKAAKSIRNPERQTIMTRMASGDVVTPSSFRVSWCDGRRGWLKDGRAMIVNLLIVQLSAQWQSMSSCLTAE
jgi:hypothetical protein